MAAINVNRDDSFEDWRLKTNEIGDVIGETADLGGQTIIETINENEALALAMVIVLGG